jgi:hypothetical protein
MRRILCGLQIAVLSLALALPAGAQVTDHLKCYKIKDSATKAKYTADLDGLAPEAGCLIKVPGKLLCVATTKTNVSPTPPGSPAGRQTGRFVCYKVKCPKGTLAPIAWTDQFGTRSIQPSVANMLCAPEPAPPGPPCVSGGCASCGSCGDGRCHLAGTGGGCGTFPLTPQCVSASTCTSSLCTSDGQCGSGQVCVIFQGNSQCCNPCP